MFFKINNAFDSHCHFLATGQVASGLSLKELKAADDIKNLKIKPEHFQNNWLIGFGWDQNQWLNKSFPTALDLDAVFPNHPVFFSRTDGHTSWINSKGIEELKAKGYEFNQDPQGGKIERDGKGNPTGILLDQAHIQALIRLPEFTSEQKKSFILVSQKLFNQGGFTHVRDLSMTWDLWQNLSEIQSKKDLTVCIEGFVTIENRNDLPRVLEDIKQMRKNPNPFLRVHGVKLFLDGSLGSKTAYLSKKYLGTETQGILCWDLEDVKYVLKTTWQHGFELAVHTIGDEAVHQMVQIARAVSAEGVLGRLHLEHVQILRNETLQLMKPLHITCHMQPCHWLSDHWWLNEVIEKDLVQSSFGWEALRRNKIQLQFGSDAPIEPTSLIRNFQALTQSAKAGWANYNGDWTTAHSHPDKNWNPSWTEFSDEKIIQVYLKGEPLL